ncbi:MAG: DUF3108 domain-containing protein [Dissulfurispiraceae bacterium]
MRGKDPEVKKIIIIVILASVFLSSYAFGLTILERFQFDLTWTGIKAGEAVLEAIDDGQCTHLISKTYSAEWVSLFYRVENMIESTTVKAANTNSPQDGFAYLPSHYSVKIREGRHRRDKEVFFDQTGGQAAYINHIEKEKATFPINDPTFDPLSGFFYVRRIPLEVGKSVFVDVFDSKKLYKLEVKVLKREAIKTSLGTFQTIVIKPIMQSEGIFYRKGDIVIWLTDDEKKIPVLIKIKASLGSINATLVGGQY